MTKLRNGSQVTARPTRKATAGTAGYFSESNDNGEPSYPGQDWFNDVIDEIVQAVTAAGVTYDPTEITNLKTAVEALRNASNLNAGILPVARLSGSYNITASNATALGGQDGEFYRNASNLNAGTVPVARTYGASAMFEKNIVSNPAFQLDAGTLKNAADLTCVVNNVAYKYDEGTGLVLPGSMSLGTDYAIYATPDGLVVSANFTVPDGYTALTSRRIGGFHHQNGEINEYSIYDLRYKPGVRDPRGMVRSPLGIWGDIYLLNTSPDLLGTSAYNATIADGSSPPKIPAIWGGDGSVQYDDFSQYTASRVLAAFGKRLPDSHEFEQLAFGSTAGYKVGSDPVTTKFDASAKSMIGCEQVSGHMWQWGSERWDRGNGSSGYNWYSADTNGEGQVYTAGSAGVGASLFGAFWYDSGYAGPRASYWPFEPWHSGEFFSARGVCDHFESC